MNCCIIEDNPLFRGAMVALLHQLHCHLKVHCIDRVGRLSGLVPKHGVPDLVLLDLTLPDTLGYSGVHEIRSAFPGCMIVVMGESRDQEEIQKCHDAGADLYISKLLEADALRAKLRQLIDPKAPVEAPLPLKLTKRQQQLVIAIENGLSNCGIGEALGIKEQTVKVHLNRLYRQLGVRSRTQAIREVRLRGVQLSS